MELKYIILLGTPSKYKGWIEYSKHPTKTTTTEYERNCFYYFYDT